MELMFCIEEPWVGTLGTPDHSGSLCQPIQANSWLSPVQREGEEAPALAPGPATVWLGSMVTAYLPPSVTLAFLKGVSGLELPTLH